MRSTSKDAASEWRDADRGGRALDRDREADADEDMLFGRIENRRHDADYLAVGGHERAAGIAGVGRGIELDKVGELALALRRPVLAMQAGDDARGHRWPD